MLKDSPIFVETDTRTVPSGNAYNCKVEIKVASKLTKVADVFENIG